MADPYAETVTTDRVPAPPESHLKEFWLVNRAFAEGGPSELFVTFKAKDGPGKSYPEVTYVYESTDHVFLRGVFERMSIAASPGTVLHAELISRGNRGRKV